MHSGLKFTLLFLIFIPLFVHSEIDEWTRVLGNVTINAEGSYETRPYPGGRYGPGLQYDETNGLIWMYGGEGYGKRLPTAQKGFLNDLWTYNINDKKWTWVSGMDTVDTVGTYKDLGNFSDGVPSSRKEAGSWFDAANQEFWIFGGYGRHTTSLTGYSNDLWCYSVENKLWRWSSGKGEDSAGVYGTKGVPLPSNIPGSRSPAGYWLDESERKLYLFGGNSKPASSGLRDYFADIWSYSIDSGLWTWEAGNSNGDIAGNYGVKGEPSSTIYPGGRELSVSWYDKEEKKAYIFGGKGLDNSTTTGYLNDLWSYDFNSGNWTYLSGSKVRNQAGIYSPADEEDQHPGSRLSSTGIFDDANKKLWLFGGEGYDKNTSTVGLLNDVWSYSIDTNQWTWESGNDTIDGTPINEEVDGDSSVDFIPGSRKSSLSFYLHPNKFAIYGGFGFDWRVERGYLNDLWTYEISEAPHQPSTGGTPEAGTPLEPGAGTPNEQPSSNGTNRFVNICIVISSLLWIILM